MPRPIRFAAAGDIHADDANRDDLARAFRDVDGAVDLILLAGDLTTYGQPEQAALLAEICRPLEVPVYAVLGNHDWHCNQVPEIVALLSGAGVRVLDRSWAIEEIDGASVGIVGLKGFIGGFPDSQLPDFGEPLLRQVYTETTDEVDALAAGLEAVAGSDHRIVHAGRFEGSVGSVPVFNVAVPVIGRDFFVFELDGATVHAAA